MSPRVAGGGRRVAGKRRFSRSGAWMAPGALVCVFLARAALGCSASCCNVARLPSLSARQPSGAALLGSARPGRGSGAPANGAAAGSPSDAFSLDETPERFGGVLALARYCVKISQRGGKAA